MAIVDPSGGEIHSPIPRTTIVPNTYATGAGTFNNGKEDLPCINVDFVCPDVANNGSMGNMNPQKSYRFIISPDNALELVEMLVQAARSMIDNG